MDSKDFMGIIQQEKNRGYVIAGGAGIIAFIAFFLPYVTVSDGLISETISGASGGNWLYLEFLAAVAVIAISAVFVFKSSLLASSQVKAAKLTMLIVSILALLVHLLFLIGVSTYASSNTDIFSSVVSVSTGFGFWLFMLAVIAMIVGSVMALRQSALTVAQSTQYPPYQQQLYSPYQEPYPPYQQPQPPYSTADQQLQPPYPPYQSVEQQPQPYSPYQSADQQQPQPYSPYQSADQQLQPPYPPYQQPQQYPPTEMEPPTQLQ